MSQSDFRRKRASWSLSDRFAAIAVITSVLLCFALSLGALRHSGKLTRNPYAAASLSSKDPLPIEFPADKPVISAKPKPHPDDSLNSNQGIASNPSSHLKTNVSPSAEYV